VQNDKIIAREKKAVASRSDLCKRAKQARSDNTSLSSADQVRDDKLRACNKKSNEKSAASVSEKRRRRRVFEQTMRDRHESQATPVSPTDENPIIRLGWFHYAFACY